MQQDSKEHFGLLRKDIKTKFISEDRITDEDRAATPVVEHKVVDKRPLWQVLKEQREKREDEMNEMYRLANRVRKLDDEEVEFLKQLAEENKEKQKSLKLKEQEELEKFRADVEAKAKEEEVQVYKPITMKRTRDVQKEILSTGIVLKKRNVNGEKASSISIQTVDKLSAKLPESRSPKSQRNLTGEVRSPESKSPKSQRDLTGEKTASPETRSPKPQESRNKIASLVAAYSSSDED